jgi:hypothetical protein
MINGLLITLLLSGGELILFTNLQNPVALPVVGAILSAIVAVVFEIAFYLFQKTWKTKGRETTESLEKTTEGVWFILTTTCIGLEMA